MSIYLPLDNNVILFVKFYYVHCQENLPQKNGKDGQFAHLFVVKSI